MQKFLGWAKERAQKARNSINNTSTAVDQPTKTASAAPPIPGNKPTASAPAPATQNPLIATEESKAASKATAATFPITLVNSTNSSTVFAYITGQAIDSNNAVFLLQADGKTPYFPANPSAVGSALSANCSIPLGAPGNSVTVTIPHIGGGRIWFSIDGHLTFLLNPGGTGAALVEPSVTNPSDPNYNVNWGFMEFTYNTAQMFANITFVDFVSIPIAIFLTNSSGATQTVPGLPTGGFASVVSQLQAQTKSDGHQGWTDLIINSSSGSALRVLSPNNGLVLKPGDFGNYYDSYVSQVLAKYATGISLSANVSGQTYTGVSNTSSGQITIGNEVFSKPNTADIFSSNSGPFTTGSDQLRNNLIPQLAAAFNRSTLLLSGSLQTPSTDFYTNSITNHYARIVHNVVTGGKGYAFPYDDVPPSTGGDQSGFVNDTAPTSLKITVGTT